MSHPQIFDPPSHQLDTSPIQITNHPHTSCAYPSHIRTNETRTVTNTMKTYRFYTNHICSNRLQLIINGASIHLHKYCTQLHITLTKHRLTIDIFNAIQTITTILEYAPYILHPKYTSFQTIILANLHYYDNSPYTYTTSPSCTSTPIPPIPKRQAYHH